MEAKKSTTYTPQFWLLCLSLFLFLSSFNLIIPELPAYLRSMGGEQYLGWIISLFSVSAAFSRPLSGKLTDRVGRIPIIIFGVSVSIICGVLYTLVAGVAGFFLIRFLHGLSAGFAPIGNTSLLTDIIPSEKRGEAMGIVGIATSLGMAVGPPVGSLIATHFSYEIMFWISSGLATVSLMVIMGVEETLKNKVPFELGMLRIKKDEVIDRDVLAPAVVMLLTIFCFGLLLTIVPDYSEYLGMENKGIFFTYLLATSLLVRLFSGRASDRYGRTVLLKIGVTFQLVAMVMIGFTSSTAAFLVAGAIFGLGAGILSPTLFAWTADLARDHQRGKAMSTLFLALEIGVFFGALTSGYLYGNDPDRFNITFLLGASISGVALIYLFVRTKLSHPQKHEPVETETVSS